MIRFWAMLGRDTKRDHGVPVMIASMVFFPVAVIVAFIAIAVIEAWRYAAPLFGFGDPTPTGLEREEW